MDSIELYEDVRDLTGKDENSYMPYEMYNRLVKRATIRTLNFLTVGTDGLQPPFTYSTEKAKGFISKLITPYSAQVVNGEMVKPDDYFSYENLYTLTLKQTGCEENKGCDTDETQDEIILTPVEMLDGQQFIERSKTFIKLLKPSLKKPIAKEVGDNIEFLPKDVGNAKLEYVRYPIAGEIKSVYDATYNDYIADPATSVDNEFDVWAKELLIFFIGDSFANYTSQQSLKQNNIITNQLKGA